MTTLQVYGHVRMICDLPRILLMIHDSQFKAKKQNTVAQTIPYGTFRRLYHWLLIIAPRPPSAS
jgi:hypothetical protein